MTLVVLALLPAACGQDSGSSDEPRDTDDLDVDGDASIPDADPDSGDAGSELLPPLRWTVYVAADIPEAVGWTADDVVRYLGLMGFDVTAEAAGQVPDCASGEGRVVFLGDGLGEPELDPLPSGPAADQAFRIHEERCPGGGVRVSLSGGGLLGRQYAAYEWLHALGVRFFHPEAEFVPEFPFWPEEPIERQHVPDFRWRSVSLHLTHPLELGDAFRLGQAEYADEARRYIDWQVKNLASFGTEGVGDGDLADYGLRRGFPRSAGFALHGQQQGSDAIIDPDDPRSEEEQIAEAIEARMGGDPETAPEFFQFTFNPSEFTEIDDRDAVRQITFIADYLAEQYPNTRVQTINHGSYGEPTAFYGMRFYDLPELAPENLAVSVHPLMFFDLFRPAPVYGNEDFGFLFDFMVRNYQRRPLWYFPEAAWWLTFDIAVPLYLPITIEARDRDIQNIAFMLEGGLDGHRVFGTGHEWGYWQNEYCPFRMAADLGYRWRDCLEDITSPMGSAGPEVAAVLARAIELQERDLLFGDLLPWLVGTDPETEVAAGIGVVFHPLPPSPRQILGWSLEEVESWEARIEPALARMDADYGGLVARLEAVEPVIPAAARPWLEEIRDGIEVTGLRARHAREAYGAVVALRRSQLLFDAPLAELAAARLEDARATTEAALAVIHRREAAYRYQPLERSIAGGPEGTEDDNWTVYGYRYLNRTHHGYYYTRIDELVAQALQTGADVVAVSDALVTPGEQVTVARADGSDVELSIDFGDGTALSGTTVAHPYAAPGFYDLTVTTTTADGPFALTGRVAVVETEFQTGFTGRILEPAGAEIIEGVFPGLVFGRAAGADVALGFAVDAGGSVGLERWTALVAVESESLLETRAARLVVPIVSRGSGEVLASVVVEDAVLVLANPTAAPIITGDLSTQAVIDAIVAVGGFDPDGARRIVASTLGYTPDELPEQVPFAVEYALQEAPGG